MKDSDVLDLIHDKNSAFLSGNGFSINFDKAFGKIYNNLFSAHKDVIHKSNFKVKSNNPRFKKKCNENYKSVLRYVRSFSESDLMEVFEDGVEFANSIRDNKELVKRLRKNGTVSELTFGLSEYDLLNQICEVYKKKGIQYINIEHWTILIYFYAAIIHIKPEEYSFPKDNSFIRILKYGDVSIVKLTNGEFNIYENVILNGFTIYFKMLFSIAIFSNGKAINFDELESKEYLDLMKLKQFLTRFDVLITLNYDRIIEFVVENEMKIERLHGKYVMNEEEFVYNQSFGINYRGEYISFSDMLIGDYFIFKTVLPAINKLSSKEFINKKIESFLEKTSRLIEVNSLSTIVIFGMNIENDQHVLRCLMLAFYKSKVEKPSIVYSYFTEKEREEFKEQFYKVMTFSGAVNEYCKKIELNFIPTQNILSNHFYK